MAPLPGAVGPVAADGFPGARLGDCVEARRRLVAKRRVTGERLMAAADAAKLIEDGDTEIVGGCMFSRTPMALLHELLRQRRKGLLIARNLSWLEAELLMIAGASRHLITSWQGLGVPWGLSRILREEVESGRVRFEEWSHFAMGLRFRAAAMGVPFLPALTMLGSDLMQTTDAKAIECPFTGETLAAIPALFADVALIHVHRADRFGNCQIDGYTHMDEDICRAATRVIVSAEEIVPDEDIRRHPDRTVIPSLVVDAVVEAPFGAYPGECYGLYETDFDHIDAYVRAVRTSGAAAVQDHLQRYVYGVSSHEDFMRLFDPAVLQAKRIAASELTVPLPPRRERLDEGTL
ncbi:MAG: CoA transferase subunit A [Chloroflexota bacterium]